MKAMKPALGAALSIATMIGGCGGGSGDAGGATGSATATGTLQGAAFTPMDAVSYSGDVALADFSGICAFGLSEAKPGATYLYLVFVGGSVVVGETDVGPSLQIQSVVADPSSCNSTIENATAGTVTVSRADASQVTGTFDLTFADDHVSGSFVAPTCSHPGDGKCS
jgi:hypothetical protein